MERQQKEMEETSDRHYELMNSGGGTGYESHHGRLMTQTSINNTARNTPLPNREVSRFAFGDEQKKHHELEVCRVWVS